MISQPYQLIKFNNSGRHHAITKTQKTILSSFGISLEDVQVYANQIARILKTKAKKAELEDEDYEDGEICDDAY